MICLVCVLLWIEPRVLHMLGKHSTYAAFPHELVLSAQSSIKIFCSVLYTFFFCRPRIQYVI
jgi:hypothetical protein